MLGPLRLPRTPQYSQDRTHSPWETRIHRLSPVPPPLKGTPPLPHVSSKAMNPTPSVFFTLLTGDQALVKVHSIPYGLIF